MPSQQVTFRSTAIVQATPGAAEVVIGSVPVSTVHPTDPVQLNAWVGLTTAGSTTVVTLRIRRNSLTGTEVTSNFSQAIVAAATSPNVYEIFAVDTPGDVAGLVYVLTCTQTAAVGTGTVGTLLLTAQTP